MAQYNNRYNDFEINGKQYTIPFIKLPNKSTDLFAEYSNNKSRLDKISQQYYGDPHHGWIIMLANPQYGGLEWSIPDGTMLRVPYPLNDTLTLYNTLLNNHLKMYGR